MISLQCSPSDGTIRLCDVSCATMQAQGTWRRCLRLLCEGFRSEGNMNGRNSPMIWALGPSAKLLLMPWPPSTSPQSREACIFNWHTAPSPSVCPAPDEVMICLPSFCSNGNHDLSDYTKAFVAQTVLIYAQAKHQGP